MSYNTVPTVATGNSWSAAQHNTYIRDNFTALWPFTANGDIAYQSTSGNLARLGIGTNGQVLTSNGSAPTWVTPTTLQAVYPVGSVYISTSSTNPNTTFGFGTWTAIQGKMLIGADGTYTAGSSGGEATHTLTSTEMPSHTHTNTAHTHTFKSWYVPLGPADAAYGYINIPANGGSTYTTNSSSITIANTGSGGAHNNLPPYLAVYIWTRTA